MSVTTHDIEANGKRYIMEWNHEELGGYGSISLTEACDDEEAAAEGNCDGHETYDFVERQ